MSALHLSIDQCLRSEGPFAAIATVPTTSGQWIWARVRVIVVCGFFYGACMGSFGGVVEDGWKQILLSAVKVPFLFLVTFILCLPSFYVMNAFAGLREDFDRVSNGLLAFQTIAAIVLAALGPITLLMNLTTGFYSFIKLWNGLVFAVASISGHYAMARAYRPLILANARHGIFLRVWVGLYAFVAIELAWVLRPFVGDPRLPFQILRPEFLGNAYVEIVKLLLRVARQAF